MCMLVMEFSIGKLIVLMIDLYVIGFYYYFFWVFSYSLRYEKNENIGVFYEFFSLKLYFSKSDMPKTVRYCSND